MLIPEPLAYFWSTLVIWLVSRALLRPGHATIAAVALGRSRSPRSSDRSSRCWFPRGVRRASVLLARRERSRAQADRLLDTAASGSARPRWSCSPSSGSDRSSHTTRLSWQIGTAFHHRLFIYGLWAIGAYAIGVGILPVLVALAWALGARCRTQRRDDPARACSSARSSAFIAYTAVKASYISTVFAIRVEERNLIYRQPRRLHRHGALVHAGRGSGSSRWALARPATAYLIATTPYHAYEHLYSDAFGPRDPRVAEPHVVPDEHRPGAAAVRHPRPLGRGGLASDLLRRRSHRRGSEWPAVAGRRRRGARLRLEPDRRDRRGRRVELDRQDLPLHAADAAGLDRPGDRPRADDVHRQVAAELERLLVDRVLEPVDRRRLVGGRERPRARSGITPDFTNLDGQSRRRSRPTSRSRHPALTWSGESPRSRVGCALPPLEADPDPRLGHRRSRPTAGCHERVYTASETERTPRSGGRHPEPGGGLRQRAALAHRHPGSKLRINADRQPAAGRLLAVGAERFARLRAIRWPFASRYGPVSCRRRRPTARSSRRSTTRGS